jgi:hypothetical protein
MKTLFKGILSILGIGMLSFCTTPSQKSAPVKNDYYVAAYVWPSCHDEIMSRETFWPEGLGEWEVIQKGDPRFEGHYQPRKPFWGYEMDDDPQVVEKWIDVATEHGVNVFIYDWYWFDEGPYLESSLNNGFLKAKNNEKMFFYLMWANHDVYKNSWNYHLHKDDWTLQWNGAVDWKNFKIIVDKVINQYFKKNNYFKINGEPVFALFSMENLMASFGGSAEETRKALDYFREEVKKAGFPGLHIQHVHWGGDLLSETAGKRYAKTIETLGVNSTALYNMGGVDEDYIVYGTNSIKIREQRDSLLNVPFFPCVSIGWDDTPRFPAKGIKDVVHINNTPQSFEMLLAKAKDYADNHPDQPKLITITAWNEWVEGSYLLPDMLYGYGYLEAVKNVMNGKYDNKNVLLDAKQ